jgi:hypothetical protein
MEFHRLEDLDPVLWSTLLKELQLMIFAKLPCSAFFRLRSVCKSWNELVNSPHFLNAHPAAPAYEPRVFWVTQKCEGILTFSFEQNQWLCRPTPQFPFKCFEKVSGLTGDYFYRLYRETEGCNWKIRVFNFLTKVWQELPPMVKPLLKVNLHTLVLDEETQNYRLFIVGSVDNSEECMQIYDCKSNRWNIISTYLQGFPSFSKLAFHNGMLYKGVDLPNDQFMVYRYDFAKNNWQHVQAHFPNRLGNDLMTVSGRLLMVGAQGHTVNIWELQLSPLEWKEVTTIYNKELTLYDFDTYSLLGEEHRVCFDSFGSGDLVLLIGSIESIGMPEKIEVYELSTDAWIPLTDDVHMLDPSRYAINT